MVAVSVYPTSCAVAVVRLPLWHTGAVFAADVWRILASRLLGARLAAVARFALTRVRSATVDICTRATILTRFAVAHGGMVTTFTNPLRRASTVELNALRTHTAHAVCTARLTVAAGSVRAVVASPPSITVAGINARFRYARAVRTTRVAVTSSFMSAILIARITAVTAANMGAVSCSFAPPMDPARVAVAACRVVAAQAVIFPAHIAIALTQKSVN